MIGGNTLKHRHISTPYAHWNDGFALSIPVKQRYTRTVGVRGNVQYNTTRIYPIVLITPLCEMQNHYLTYGKGGANPSGPSPPLSYLIWTALEDETPPAFIFPKYWRNAARRRNRGFNRGAVVPKHSDTRERESDETFFIPSCAVIQISRREDKRDV